MVSRILIIFSVVLFITSCSSKACKELILDAVKLHDTATHSGQTYYLYSRTTGWHEKVVFFELYEKSPTFNQCQHADIKPVFIRAFDDTPENSFIKQLILQPEKPEKIKIIYTTDENEGFSNVYDVKFTQ